MKTLLGILIFSSVAVAAGGASPIVGAWHLEKWIVRTPSGDELEFCKGAKGILMYEASGYVSTSINCPAAKPGPTSAISEPGDAYGRVFFYAGTYTVDEGVIYKAVANSTFLPLIGRIVERKIETVSDKELILTGPFGPKGQSLWIRWIR